MTNCVRRTPKFFHRKLNEINKQKQAFSKIRNVTSKSMLPTQMSNVRNPI
jgi:hypothetical protein